MMIPCVRMPQHGITQRYEVHDVAIFVQWPFHRHANSIVVAMQPLTNISGERDEVRSGKNKRLFGNLDAENCFRHRVISIAKDKRKTRKQTRDELTY